MKKLKSIFDKAFKIIDFIEPILDFLLIILLWLIALTDIEVSNDLILMALAVILTKITYKKL